MPGGLAVDLHRHLSLLALCATAAHGASGALADWQKRGHDVQAVITRAARRFETPLTFEAITRHPVGPTQWQTGRNAAIEHIPIAEPPGLPG